MRSFTMDFTIATVLKSQIMTRVSFSNRSHLSSSQSGLRYRLSRYSSSPRSLSGFANAACSIWATKLRWTSSRSYGFATCFARSSGFCFLRNAHSARTSTSLYFERTSPGWLTPFVCSAVSLLLLAFILTSFGCYSDLDF